MLTEPSPTSIVMKTLLLCCCFYTTTSETIVIGRKLEGASLGGIFLSQWSEYFQNCCHILGPYRSPILLLESYLLSDWFWCVWVGLKMNPSGWTLFRTRVGDPWCSQCCSLYKKNSTPKQKALAYCRVWLPPQNTRWCFQFRWQNSIEGSQEQPHCWRKKIQGHIHLKVQEHVQVCSNSVLEGNRPAEFSSNVPQDTCLDVSIIAASQFKGCILRRMLRF